MNAFSNSPTKLCLSLSTLLVVLAGWTFFRAPPDDLLGTWKVDLRPTPEAEAYFQEMVITSVGGDSLTGTFYGAPIRDGHLNLEWGALRFAFVTEDSGGAYHTSGTLRGDQIEGMTHSLGRGFLAYWRAERVATEE